jgi:hypothetical protein
MSRSLSIKASEHDEQAAVVQWFDLQYPKYAGLLFAVPNAGKRGYKTANRLKAEGLRAGVSDLMLPVARWGYHGVFIEMKTGTRKMSDAQSEFIDRVIEQGYLAACCHGADIAIDLIKRYMQSDSAPQKEPI